MRFIHTVDQIHDEGHMAQAAFGVSVRVVEILRSATGRVVGSKVLLLVGPGNNGGDALWAGALLSKRGVDVRAVCTNERFHEFAAAKFTAAGGRYIELNDAEAFAPDVVLDGIFGVGFRDVLSDDIKHAIAKTQELGTAVAVDAPSGIHADTGCIADGAFKAQITLTIGTLKPGLLTGQGKALSGVLELVPLDFSYPAADGFVVDYSDLELCYSPAPILSHKYSRGVAFINAGSSKYPGAGVLAAGGARASGVGLVQFAGEQSSVVVSTYPDVVPSDDLSRADSILVGCGESGTSDKLAEYLATDLPVVIDAHALTFLKETPIQTALDQRHVRGAITVLTPHEGEAKRLGFDESDRLARARTIAQAFNSYVLLKGAGTVIASPSGSYAIDQYGTVALATAGSGDVLAGLIAGTLAHTGVRQSPAFAQKLALEAIACAVALHGLAGRRAGNGCTATTLVQALVEVHSELVDATQ